MWLNPEWLGGWAIRQECGYSLGPVKGRGKTHLVVGGALPWVGALELYEMETVSGAAVDVHCSLSLTVSIT